jgi:hypothetical protein
LSAYVKKISDFLVGTVVRWMKVVMTPPAISMRIAQRQRCDIEEAWRSRHCIFSDVSEERAAVGL